MLRELSKVEQRYNAVLAVIGGGMRVTTVARSSGCTETRIMAYR
jgi:hypothetical protein